jgi:hypothetical protein
MGNGPLGTDDNPGFNDEGTGANCHNSLDGSLCASNPSQTEIDQFLMHAAQNLSMANGWLNTSVDDYLPYLRGVPSEFDSTLILRERNGSPNMRWQAQTGRVCPSCQHWQLIFIGQSTPRGWRLQVSGFLNASDYSELLQLLAGARQEHARLRKDAVSAAAIASQEVLDALNLDTDAENRTEHRQFAAAELAAKVRCFGDRAMILDEFDRAILGGAGLGHKTFLTANPDKCGHALG